MSENIEVTEVSRHRNGICGEPFYVCLFADPDQPGMDHMVAVVFGDEDDEGWFVGRSMPQVAVLSIGELAEGNIAFARGNSWRGDRYADALYDAIREHEEGWRERLERDNDPAVPIGERLARMIEGSTSEDAALIETALAKEALHCEEEGLDDAAAKYRELEDRYHGLAARA